MKQQLNGHCHNEGQWNSSWMVIVITKAHEASVKWSFTQQRPISTLQVLSRHFCRQDPRTKTKTTKCVVTLDHPPKTLLPLKKLATCRVAHCSNRLVSCEWAGWKMLSTHCSCESVTGLETDRKNRFCCSVGCINWPCHSFHLNSSVIKNSIRSKKYKQMLVDEWARCRRGNNRRRNQFIDDEAVWGHRFCLENSKEESQAQVKGRVS